MRTLLAAVLTVTAFAHAAQGAEAEKPMNYNDGVFCHAVFTTTLDMAAAAGTDTGGNSMADAYAYFAKRDAQQIGASEGKTAAQIDADLAAAISETTEMARKGEFDPPKPASVYFEVCVDIINRRDGM